MLVLHGTSPQVDSLNVQSIQSIQSFDVATCGIVTTSYTTAWRQSYVVFPWLDAGVLTYIRAVIGFQLVSTCPSTRFLHPRMEGCFV